MKLYDLAGSEDNRRTSPFCWRIRLALAYKGIAFNAVPWRGVEKDTIAFTGQRQVPVLIDGDTTIVDSWRIAEYLDSTYLEAPSFFGSQEGKGGVKFIVHWLDHIIYPILMQIVCLDALNVSHKKDQTFFRNKWEYLHGMAVEEAKELTMSSCRCLAHHAADHDSITHDHQAVHLITLSLKFAGRAYVPQFQQALKPMQIILEEQPFLGGTEPNFADLAVAGNFAWARAVSPIQLLDQNDPIYDWRERMFNRFHQVVQPTIGYQGSLLPAHKVDETAIEPKKGHDADIRMNAVAQ